MLIGLPHYSPLSSTCGSLSTLKLVSSHRTTNLFHSALSVLPATSNTTALVTPRQTALIESLRTFLTRKQCRKALVTLDSQAYLEKLSTTHCLPSPRHICCAQSVQFCIPPMCKLLQLAGAAYKLVRAATCIAGVGRALTCIDLVNTPTRYAALRPTVTAAFHSDARPAAEKSWI